MTPRQVFLQTLAAEPRVAFDLILYSSHYTVHSQTFTVPPVRQLFWTPTSAQKCWDVAEETNSPNHSSYKEKKNRYLLFWQYGCAGIRNKWQIQDKTSFIWCPKNSTCALWSDTKKPQKYFQRNQFHPPGKDFSTLRRKTNIEIKRENTEICRGILL